MAVRVVSNSLATGRKMAEEPALKKAVCRVLAKAEAPTIHQP